MATIKTAKAAKAVTAAKAAKGKTIAKRASAEAAASAAIHAALIGVRDAAAANSGALLAMLRATAQYRPVTTDELIAAGVANPASAKVRASEYNVGDRAAAVLGREAVLARIDAAAAAGGAGYRATLETLRDAVKLGKAHMQASGRKVMTAREAAECMDEAADAREAAATAKREPRAGKGKGKGNAPAVKPLTVPQEPAAALAFFIAKAMEAARLVPADGRTAALNKAINAVGKADEAMRGK